MSDLVRNIDLEIPLQERPDVPNPEGVQPGSELKPKLEISEAKLKALTTNASFLDNASPSNAQVVAQVRQLTRQVSGLIRLLLRSPEEP